MKILILGKGWIGTKCSEAWEDSEIVSRRINSIDDAKSLIEDYSPDVILNAAGVTGKPTVDWCESHVKETVEGNTILPFYLAEACKDAGVYMLHIGSGCVFYGDSAHEDGLWRPDDFANPQVVYSAAKYAGDLILGNYENVGIARIRMPIDSIPGPRNLIDKLVAYDKVNDVENSVTVLQDMILVFRELLKKEAKGNFHVVNPGVITHKTIIDLYKRYIDSSLEKNWIDESELVELGLATKKRSNNFLASPNLEKYGIEMRNIDVAMEELMQEYKQNLKK